MPTLSPSEVVAIVPVRALEGAKSRLGGALDAEERRDLVERLLDRTVRAIRDAGIDDLVVVSPDPEVLERASSFGARPLAQRHGGLNDALDAARLGLGAAVRAVLVLPADLPLVEPGPIRALLDAAGDLGPGVGTAGDGTRADAVVVLAPDRHGDGTNALLVAPPDAIAFGFGTASRRRHRRRAEAAGARFVEVAGPLSIDLDTPDDLLLVERRLIADEVR